MVKETFEARSTDLAAYLDALGVPYQGCFRNADGKPRFVFANPNDAAWQASLEYRDGRGTALVHAPAFIASYRKMCHQARMARAHLKETTQDEQRPIV